MSESPTGPIARIQGAVFRHNNKNYFLGLCPMTGAVQIFEMGKGAPQGIAIPFPAIIDFAYSAKEMQEEQDDTPSIIT